MKKFNPNTLNFRSEASKKIAELFPEVIADGEIDFEVLRQILEDDLVPTDSNEQYRFTWPGKNNVKKLADTQVKNTTLLPVKSKSKNWENTDNVYIEGDNLEVLRLLQSSYTEKVKFMYVDPPYNTGKDFIYKDNFHENQREYLLKTGQINELGDFTTTNRESNGRFHTDWLNMMYPRLKLARNLLTEDGIIFLSIDDNEFINLRRIMDEIFGPHNFVGTLSVENNPKGRKNSSFISVSSEYLVVYAKNIDASYFIENVPKSSNDMDLDENGKYVHNSGKRVLVGENNFNNIVTNFNSQKNYTVYYNNHTDDIKLLQEKSVDDSEITLIKNGYKRYYTYNGDYLVENTYTLNKFKDLFNEGALQFTDDKIFEKNFNDTIRIKSQLSNRKYEAIVDGKKKMFNFDLTTTGAGNYLKKLFNLKHVPFSAPKNVGLIKLILTLIDDKDMIVMDFFSGSSTTADAVMQQNDKDGGTRKFVMVQLQEDLEKNLNNASSATKKNISSAISYLKEKRLPPYLTELAQERIRLAGESILHNNHTNQDLDIGYKVYRLAESTLLEWDTDPDKFEKQLDLFNNPFREEVTDEQVATELAIKSGIKLNVKPEIFEDIYHYKTEDKEVFIVLGNYDESLLDYLNEKRVHHTIKVILKEVDGGSELKFNMVHSLEQNDSLNNHIILEWL